jgi:predicted nuclease of predicted toxin-antitoxin system
LRFLVDAQLPPALARAITDAGHDAVHVCDIEMTSASDHAVRGEAARREAVILTKDEDFVFIGRTRDTTSSPAVVWIRVGNCSRRNLLAAVLPLLPTIVQMLEAGEKLIEIR